MSSATPRLNHCFERCILALALVLRRDPTETLGALKEHYQLDALTGNLRPPLLLKGKRALLASTA